MRILTKRFELDATSGYVFIRLGTRQAFWNFKTGEKVVDRQR